MFTASSTFLGSVLVAYHHWIGTVSDDDLPFSSQGLCGTTTGTASPDMMTTPWLGRYYIVGQVAVSSNPEKAARPKLFRSLDNHFHFNISVHKKKNINWRSFFCFLFSMLETNFRKLLLLICARKLLR